MAGLNFQKAIDGVSGALGFFDFSFLISGAATYTVLCYTLGCMGQLHPFNSLVVNILISIVTVYICGLISFAGGRWLRTKIRWFSKIIRCPISKDFSQLFDEAYVFPLTDKANKLDRTAYKGKEEIFYTYMWFRLREEKGAAATLDHINRYWVMQAVFEGLVFSFLFSTVCLAYLLTVNGCTTVWWLAMLVSVVALPICFHEATRYAETQIFEVVLAYRYYEK